MKKCPNCGTIVSDDCHYCVRCGCPLTHQKSVTPTGQQKNTDVEYLEDDENKVVKYSIIAGVIVVLLAVLGFYFFKGHGKLSGNSNMTDSLSDTLATVGNQDEIEEQSEDDILKLHPGFQLLCSVTGDFDGDGNKETLYAINPKSDDGPFVEYLCFSKKTLPSIKIQTHGIYVPDSKPKNAGDLDGDGGDEISFYSSGYSSNWNGYYIWSYKNGKWIVPIEPIFLPEWALEDGYVPVRKSHKKGYLEIDDNQELVDDEDSTSMEYTHNGLRFERKLVKFNNKGYKVNF